MENSEIQQSLISEKSELVLNNESIEYLKETRKWTMFFAILGFVVIGFMAIGALVMGMIGIVGGNFGGFQGTAFFGIFAIIYIIIGALYFFPVLYMLKFSIYMKKAIEQTNQGDLSLAFLNLKSHYRFMGIFTIALFGLYILIIIVVLLIGLASIF